MPFNRILGQDQPKRIIQKALKTGSVPHAYLFYGPESTGKKLTAIETAKALNCGVSGPEDNCGACPSCDKIERRIHPDFFLLEPVKDPPTAREASIKIESIRELQKKLAYLPYEGKTKVAIINDIEKMNPQAANSFLKTLEEPPSSTVIILIAANPYRLLPTLVSRCQGIRFQPLSAGSVKKIMLGQIESESMDMDPGEIELRAIRSMGQISRALEEDLLKAGEQRDELLELIGNASFDRMDMIFKWAKAQARGSDNLQGVLDELLNLLRDLAILKNQPGSEGIINRDLLQKMKSLVEKKSLPGLLKMFDSVHRTKLALSANANVQLSLENMLIQFCEAA